jgi:hypothetical protein
MRFPVCSPRPLSIPVRAGRVEPVQILRRRPSAEAWLPLLGSTDEGEGGLHLPLGHAARTPSKPAPLQVRKKVQFGYILAPYLYGAGTECPPGPVSRITLVSWPFPLSVTLRKALPDPREQPLRCSTPRALSANNCPIVKYLHSAVTIRFEQE